MRTFRIGIAGGLLAAVLAAGIVTGSAAEEAAAPQPAAESCSLLGCLLHPRREAAVAPPPAAAPASDLAREDAEPSKPVRAKPKPLAAVTLAVGAEERPRLRALAAARPRHRLRLVPPRDGEAELTLAPTLDAASAAASLHLYSEQMLVIAGPAVKSLADLRDRQVSFGPADGAGTAVARRVFAAAGIAVREAPLDEANALDGLATGDIDAVVLLAPQPSPVVAKLRSPGLHLVDWPEGINVPAGARSLLLAANSYPGLAAGPTRVLAVDAVLTLTAKGAKSAAARGFFASLKQQTGALARHGFDRLGADLDARRARRLASDERH